MNNRTNITKGLVTGRFSRLLLPPVSAHYRRHRAVSLQCRQSPESLLGEVATAVHRGATATAPVSRGVGDSIRLRSSGSHDFGVCLSHPLMRPRTVKSDLHAETVEYSVSGRGDSVSEAGAGGDLLPRLPRMAQNPAVVCRWGRTVRARLGRRRASAFPGEFAEDNRSSPVPLAMSLSDSPAAKATGSRGYRRALGHLCGGPRLGSCRAEFLGEDGDRDERGRW